MDAALSNLRWLFTPCHVHPLLSRQCKGQTSGHLLAAWGQADWRREAKQTKLWSPAVYMAQVQPAQIAQPAAALGVHRQRQAKGCRWGRRGGRHTR